LIVWFKVQKLFYLDISQQLFFNSTKQSLAKEKNIYIYVCVYIRIESVVSLIITVGNFAICKRIRKIGMQSSDNVCLQHFSARRSKGRQRRTTNLSSSQTWSWL